MAEASKLELILLAKDKMSPAIQRLLKLLKQTEKDGKTSTNAVDKLTKKLERAPKVDGIKKANAELGKTATAAGAAAVAEEKLNNARKRGVRNSSGVKQETADKKKLAAANEKAAASEEKLNNARKRGIRGGSSNRRSPISPTAPPNRPPRGSGNGSFEENLLQGGTGLALTGAAKKGFGSAMTKQEALTNLRNSFYRSGVAASELNAQMVNAEKQADELGNKLPGTTSDFLALFSTMRERGIETQTILEGAGKAASYLAVANKEDVQEVGQNLAAFGQMFDLKGEQYVKAANLMSKIRTSKGLGSEELIEASKYFGGRTAAALGMKGSQGAEETVRFLAFMRQKTGMEGSQLGTSSSSFFREFVKAKQKNKQSDPLGDIKKATGIDLTLFDKKGAFMGVENAINEFSKLKGKLSNEQQMSFGQKMAGDEGAAVFSAMVEYGDQYKSFNQDVNQSIGLMDKSAKNAENLTNKMEALAGSLENLGAAGFMPLLSPIGTLTDKTNEWTGSLTEAAKAQPVFAATTSGVLSLAGALLTLKAGSGILSGLASRFGTVTEAAAGSASTVGRFGKGLLSLPTALKIGLTVVVAAEAWEQIQKMRATIDDWKKMNTGLDSAGADSYKAQKQEDQTLLEQGKTPDYKNRAKDAFSLLQQGNQELSKALDPDKLGWGEWWARGVGALMGKDTNFSLYQGKPTTTDILQNPKYYARVGEVEKMPFNQQKVDGAFTNAFDRVASEIAAVRNLQNRAPMLNDPNTMTAFRRDVQPTLGLSDIKNQFLNEILKSAFPASFAESSQQMAQSSGLLNQSFLNLVQPVTSATDQMLGLSNNSTNATNAVGNLANATNSAANRINAVQITPPTFAPIRVPVFGQPTAPVFGGSMFGRSMFGRAKGGSVKKGHPYPVGEIGPEIFVPSASGSIVSNDILRRSSGANSAVQNVHLNVSINIDGSTGDAEKIAAEIRREFSAAVSEIKAELAPDNLARRVASSAERHAERT